jgi:hypothetical protein
MTNCPYCNEPVNSINIRTDHLSSGMQLMPMCKPNVHSQAEVTQITLERSHYTKTQSLPVPITTLDV